MILTIVFSVILLLFLILFRIKKRNNKPMVLAIALAVIGFCILVVSLIKIDFDSNYFAWRGSIDSKTASELGGFLTGFVGIFWTAAGVILIYATFNEQKKQNEKQHFENQFFGMMSLYHNLVDKTKGDVLVIKPDKTECKYFEGRDYIIAFIKLLKDGVCGNKNYARFENYLKRKWNESEDYRFYLQADYPDDDVPVFDMLSLFDKNMKMLSEKMCGELYECFYLFYQDRLGHLMRLMYNIFKFIIEYRKKYGDEKVYIDLIQAQLSNSELALIFYNGLSKYARSSTGEKKYKTWLKEYDFFQNIDDSVLLHENHKDYYIKKRT